jgi:hypothetical protein
MVKNDGVEKTTLAKTARQSSHASVVKKLWIIAMSLRRAALDCSRRRQCLFALALLLSLGFAMALAWRTWPTQKLLILLASIYVLVAATLLLFKSVRNSAEKIGPLLNLINVIAAIAVLGQLFVTIDQFDKAKEYEDRVKAKQFEARVNTLMFELLGNLNVCQFILVENRDTIEQAAKLPRNFFYFPMIEEFLRSGEITKDDLLVALYSAYHHMKIAQDIMDKTMTVEFSKSIFNNEAGIVNRSNKWNKEQMHFLIKNTTLAKSYLEQGLSKLPIYIEERSRRRGR